MRTGDRLRRSTYAYTEQKRNTKGQGADGNMQRDQSMFTFEANSVQGTVGIVEKLTVSIGYLPILLRAPH